TGATRCSAAPTRVSTLGPAASCAPQAPTREAPSTWKTTSITEPTLTAAPGLCPSGIGWYDVPAACSQARRRDPPLFADERAAALHHLDQALVREHADGFAGGEPRHAELPDQLRLRRHGAARADLPGLDPLAQDSSYLQVDGCFALVIKRHGGTVPRPSGAYPGRSVHSPEHRARLVGKEMAPGSASATPPEATGAEVRFP